MPLNGHTISCWDDGTFLNLDGGDGWQLHKHTKILLLLKNKLVYPWLLWGPAAAHRLFLAVASGAAPGCPGASRWRLLLRVRAPGGWVPKPWCAGPAALRQAGLPTMNRTQASAWANDSPETTGPQASPSSTCALKTDGFFMICGLYLHKGWLKQLWNYISIIKHLIFK